MLAIVFAIAFFASTIGAICGIGGGIIIKPAMDAVGAADVATINFLSGCTVLSMTCYSVIKSKVSGDSKIDPKIDTPLAVGAAAGGLAGRQMFSAVASFFGDANIAGAVQAGTLMLVTAGTLLYTLNKEKIATRNVTGVIPCMAIGLVLGISSSFLGIGGGPINLVVLFYFFTMSTNARPKARCTSSCSRRPPARSRRLRAVCPTSTSHCSRAWPPAASSAASRVAP